MKRHVLLIGLPGAGKTTVGRLVARELGAGFSDLDELIEREQQTTIREIFATRGEAAFRALERDAAAKIIAGDPGVLAPGGGWAAQPGVLDTAAARCLVIYLKTDPGEAARRVGRSRTRPLLAGADPADRMRELFAGRSEFYSRAEATVETDHRSPAEVSAEVVKLARSRAGW